MILVIADIPYEPLISAFVDVVGLCLSAVGAYKAYYSVTDKFSWAAALAEIVAYVSLVVDISIMLLTDYSDAWESLGGGD